MRPPGAAHAVVWGSAPLGALRSLWDLILGARRSLWDHISQFGRAARSRSHTAGVLVFGYCKGYIAYISVGSCCEYHNLPISTTPWINVPPPGRGETLPPYPPTPWPGMASDHLLTLTQDLAGVDTPK